MLHKNTIRIEGVENLPIRNSDMSGVQMTRHLLAAGLSDTNGLVADYVELPPGFIHRMHRHPLADQILIPLCGSAIRLTVEDDACALEYGTVGIARRGRW